MRSRLKIAGAAAAVMMAAGALSPALAHHASEHSHPDGRPIAGCATPPPEKSGTTYASGFTVWAGTQTSEGTTVGYRTRDVYAYAAVGPNGAKATVFQPWWDSNGPTKGPHWVDVAASAGPGGASSCNKSRTTNS